MSTWVAGSFLIPVPWFTSINAAVVIVLAPLVAAFWVRLGTRNQRVDIVQKYAFALAMVTVGHLLMYLSARNAAPAALASVWIPLVALSLLGMGEIVAWTATYGMVSRAAPAGFASVAMGAWYLLTLGLGGYLSGFTGGLLENRSDLPARSARSPRSWAQPASSPYCCEVLCCASPPVPTFRSSEDPGMSADHDGTTALHRALGTFDLVLLNVSAIVGLRYLSIAAQIGPSSITLWLLGLITFLIPAALTVLELSSRLPGEGGMYLWSKAAFGELHAFIAGWSYWIANLVFFPSSRWDRPARLENYRVIAAGRQTAEKAHWIRGVESDEPLRVLGMVVKPIAIATATRE